MCTATFKMSQSLEAHIKNKHFKNTTRSANISISWDMDITETKIEYKFPCQTCDIKFPNLLALQAHMKVHEEKKFVCEAEDCMKTFASYSNLYVHKKSKHEHISWACKMCAAHFRYLFI